MTDETGKGTFEIGLVMAGAISAGAYTAGVISFLLEALDAWYREKEAGNKSVPQHDVKIRLISGTSAGGMTAGILGMSLFRDLPAVTCPEIELHSQNPLFESWVNMADIEGFLRIDDRYRDPLPSLLDSTLLDRIADTVFASPLPCRRRPYVDPEPDLILCLTNLRGIPYELAFHGDKDDMHAMTTHADYLHFLLTDDRTSAGHCTRPCHILNPFNRSDEMWQLLRQGCLASGAVPLALESRRMVTNPQHYDSRIRAVTQSVRKAPGARGIRPSQYEESALKPSWPGVLRGEIESTRGYAFWASDGGLINNEPFELARRLLAERDGRTKKPRGSGHSLVIMIDPFIGRSEESLADDTGHRLSPAATAGKILNVLRSQARFKAEELAQAPDPKVNNRFMIAPKRTDKRGKRVVSDRAIASGSLGGFGGFLDRSFRVHDYLLGRRNCQKFLRDRLVLELNRTDRHPEFGITGEQAKRLKWARATEYSSGREVIPVIPLMESADADSGRPGWPELGADRFDLIAGKLLPRLDLVVRKLSDPLRWYFQWPLLTAWWLGLRWMARRKIMDHIRRDLAGRGLMRDQD